MFRNATESSAILTGLRENINDEQKWLALVNSQSSAAHQIEMLSRAVATVPSSVLLWSELVRVKTINEDHNGLFEILRDALCLFPENLDLWRVMFSLFPSMEIFSTALRSIDNSLVWTEYMKFILIGNLSPIQRLECCKHYLEFDATQLSITIKSLVEAGHEEVAAELLLQNGDSVSFDVWESVVSHNKNQNRMHILEAALTRFPSHEAAIATLLAQEKLANTGFNDARSFLLRRLESPANVASFCDIFSTIVSLYENEIEATMRTKGQGGWGTAQLLTEFSNILRKRPNLLSNAAIRQFPNDVKLWLDRAQLWQNRPHMAADVIETAIKTIDPLNAVNGTIADLHIRYASLLVSNGSETKQACETLEAVLNEKHMNSESKTKVYIALADIHQGPRNDHQTAVKILETALLHFSSNSKLWLHYLSVLVESESPKLLGAFSRCCIQGMTTMRMALMVAKAFPDGSSNQLAVFDKGVSMFPTQMVLPLWRHYLVASNSILNIHQLRALYSRAFEVYANHKSSYEELAVLYYEAEKSHSDGSMLMARKQLLHIIGKSTNTQVWNVYISTFEGDISEKRQAFEQAINRLDDSEAITMALKMAEFEESQGEINRSRALYEYATRINHSPQGLEAWKQFEERYGSTDPGPDKIHFVPAVEMES